MWGIYRLENAALVELAFNCKALEKSSYLSF